MLRVCALIACVITLACAVPNFHGPTWQNRTASSKQQILWQVVTQDLSSGPWPSTLEEAELFVESMDPTFDTVADDFPYQGPFDAFKRKKLIHSVGCIAQAVFSPLSNSYTGLFRGSNYALIRYSTATQPGTEQQQFVPGISLKFLRDGVKSANFMAMYSLEGSDSFNPFKHDLTNHVPNLSLNASTALHLVAEKFLSASAFPTMLGLKDFASFDEHGQEVSHASFPFRLIFQAKKDLKSKFPDTYSGLLCDQLATLPPRDLYNVYAQDSPYAQPKLIGTLSTKTPFTTSNYGDQSLFFEHERMEDDFADRPEWVKPATEIFQKQGTMPYFNGDADLPDLSEEI